MKYWLSSPLLQQSCITHKQANTKEGKAAQPSTPTKLWYTALLPREIKVGKKVSCSRAYSFALTLQLWCFFDCARFSFLLFFLLYTTRKEKRQRNKADGGATMRRGRGRRSGTAGRRNSFSTDLRMRFPFPFFLCALSLTRCSSFCFPPIQRECTCQAAFVTFHDIGFC